MPVGNAEYFDNLNKEIKEKQSELSLSSSKVVAMKQMIADRDKEIEKLKLDLIMQTNILLMKEWGK
jgi:hypothetical protein